MARQFSADDPERMKWQNPGDILMSIGLKPGMIFVDVGCGDGFFALPAARIVGPQGNVIAADIDAGAVARLKEAVQREELRNLSASVKPAEELIACDHCADIVFFGIDLHDFSDPEQVIANAGKMLKAGGLLIDLDWKNEPMKHGPPQWKRFSPEKARGMIVSGGFRIRSITDAGQYHYLIIAEN